MKRKKIVEKLNNANLWLSLTDEQIGMIADELATNDGSADVSISVCDHWWRNTGTTLQGKPVKQCDKCGKTEC